MAPNSTFADKVVKRPVSDSKTKVFKEYTNEEVEKHNSETDVWISIHGKVYDVTRFVKYHPGGSLPIINLAGRDVTEPFHGFHPEEILAKKLPHYQVGVIKDYKEQQVRKDFFEVYEKMKAEGIYDTNYVWYALKFLWQVVIFAVFFAVFLAAIDNKSTFLYVVSAAILGIFWQQFAFLGHDFGHNSVTHVRDRDWYFGVFITAFFGVSGQWWKRNHNTHHVVTNSVEHDPDIQHLPIFAVTDKIFKGYYSSYYKLQKKFDTASQVLTSYQHYLFYPVMAVARVNLHVQSLILCLDPRVKVRGRFYELGAMLIYAIWFGAILRMIPETSNRFIFFLISYAVCGILHVQICLSHFAMDTYYGTGFKAGDQKHWLKVQLDTTMNVDCPWWMDWFHGGLQFQTEHHLFPRIPRHNLRYVMEKYVKPLAKKHGVKHNAYTFWDSNVKLVKHMKDAAMMARKHPNEFLAKNYLLPLLQADG